MEKFFDFLPFCERCLSKRSETSERVHGPVLHAHVLTLALLLLLQAHGKGTTDRVRESFAARGSGRRLFERVLDRQETVTQPST